MTEQLPPNSQIKMKYLGSEGTASYPMLPRLSTAGAVSTVVEKGAEVKEEPVVKRLPEKGSCDKRPWILGVLGICFLAVSYGMHVTDPVESLLEAKLQLAEGTDILTMWKKPPMELILKLYIFNVTNPEEFLAGEEKLRLEEIGPYYFREMLEHTNVTFNPNNTMTYKQRFWQEYIPEMTERNPAEERITVPNISLLGVASAMHKASIFTNMGINTLVKYVDSQPFLDLTVEEFLWGYDDPLVKLANKFMPSVAFDQISVMNLMYNNAEDTVTMSTARGPPPELGNISELTLVDYNGFPELDQWRWPNGSSNRCTVLQGATEGQILPRRMAPNTTIWVYRKSLCRVVPLEHVYDSVAEGGFPVYSYKVPESARESADVNPDNECFCRKQIAPCLPTGLMDLTPCTYDLPLAASLPHFLHADPALLDAVEGLSPSEELHGSVFQVQPEVGLPIDSRSRLQTNMVVHKTRLIPRVAPFNEMVIPLFWTELYTAKLPDSLASELSLAIFTAPIIRKALVMAPAVLGVFLLLLGAWCFYRGRSTRRQKGSLLKVSQETPQRC